MHVSAFSEGKIKIFMSSDLYESPVLLLSLNCRLFLYRNKKYFLLDIRLEDVDQN